MAHASASASATRHVYDVFISHRGPDVKKTFASHLYRRLLSSGFRVFLDRPELQRGENSETQIEQAIKTATVHVAIFSSGYAESRWCLDELVLMLKSTESGKATIIPVFYNVKPSDLRWTDQANNNNGRYTEALLNHEKKGRYDQERLRTWRKALSDVSYISGFELEACDGDEGELVDRVAQQVHKRVRKAPLEVATYPTGLDEKLQDFERTVILEQQQRRGEPKAVGIVGLGGVGKTTLAKLFFNTKRSDYQQSCFLPDVRDAAARRLLPSLQSKLYKDLTGRDQLMDNVDEGIAMLKDRLSCGPALVVLDDVDHVEQLAALFSPVKDVLPGDSLIIVTSRNHEVLAISGIRASSVYKMTGLDEEHSQELFCSHAFHQPYPAVGYEKLVSKFLNACQGLPLSLKVIGALLYMERPDLESWEAKLRKLRNVLPTDIKGRLRISYDSLDEEEKEIFLDIACFFIGIKTDTAIRLWDGSGWEGSLGLRTLESKCLITVDQKNCIRMHDHLRDLGRDLADKEAPGCPRRLWRPTDDHFRNVPIQSTVRGISLVQEVSDKSFQTPVDFSPHIVEMSGLQLVRAPGDYLESIFKRMRHPDLLWLQCDRYSYSSIPSWIPIKNLRVLELGVQWSNVILETLWNTESEVPLQLRELNIAHLLWLPKSIGQLKFLEKIELHNFKGTLPEEFFLLRSLKHLRLRAGMKSFPDSLGNLTKLQHIDLSTCQNLQALRPSFGKLTNLQHIDLSLCRDLKTLPLSFGNLTQLQHLNLRRCDTLNMLPDSFGNLIRLKQLDLSYCSKLTLSSETLGNISTLESLNFRSCTKLEVLPFQMTHQRSLEELNLLWTNLKEMPNSNGDLVNLEILLLESPSLETLPHSLGNLTNLRELTLNLANLKYWPDWVRELKQLTSLSISRSQVREVPFANVEKFVGGGRLFDSSIHKCMVRLRSLNLSETKITEISFGEGVCPVLQYLDLRLCRDLVEIGALPTTLISLNMKGCHVLKKITGIHGLAKLQTLDIGWCSEIEQLPGLETLISLETFRTTRGCNMFRVLELAEAANPESHILKKVIHLMKTQAWTIRG